MELDTPYLVPAHCYHPNYNIRVSSVHVVVGWGDSTSGRI